MQAVILAGGKGTRLGDMTISMPKPMLKIGDRPILAHQLDLLKKYGITQIIIICGYLSETIMSYFGNGNAFGVSINYHVETTPLGTTGGLKEIQDQLDEDFLVLYGDAMLNINLSRLIQFHKAKCGCCTLVIHPNDHPYDSDLVEIDDNNKITAFHSKPHIKEQFYQNLVNAGLYVFNRKIIKYIQKDKKADFGKDVFPSILHQENMFGYVTPEYIKDMGTPKRLEMVENDYSFGKIERSNIDHKRPAIFLDRDGVINEDVPFLKDINKFQLLPCAAEAIRKINQSDFLAIVITNQPVVARNLCTIYDINKIHNKMETLLGAGGAKLDAIYFCPHHPDKGYPEENKDFKIVCECRKPKTGMVLWAQKKFNIDLSKSYMIGDSGRDIDCGKAAGLTTIGVRTGKGCSDCLERIDFMFNDLLEAACFILNKSCKNPKN